jgi:fructose-1,6-bisphosphatase/inositol monophosphatase family enzyme
MPERDVKLEVDRLAEEAVCGTILEAFPDHGILAEEGGEIRVGADFLWIVDPLDGTVNYFHGIPYYCTSIACYQKPSGDSSSATGLSALGTPVVGVVHAPATDEMLVATSGEGATLNGLPIEASRATRLEECAFAMGFGKTLARGREMVAVAGKVAEHVRKLRCLGAGAYDLANVAAGRLEGFYERGLRTWDIAAGAVLLAETGAVLYADEYEPTWWNVLAAAPAVAAKLSRTIGLPAMATGC